MASAVLAWAVASGAAERGLGVTAAQVVGRAIPYVQAGIVLLGVLPAAHEDAGRQVRTSLLAVPARTALLAAKTVAAALVVTVGAVVAVGVGLLVALWASPSQSAGGGVGQTAGEVGGMVGYLALMGAFSHVVATLVRQLAGALAGVLVLVLVVSPLLAAATTWARWLPDRAAAALYQSGSTMSAASGVFVMTIWIMAIGAAAFWRFVIDDA